MNYPITIQFTPAEWKVIEHRLAAPDAIADGLTDVPEGEEELAVNASRDEIIDRASSMYGPDVELKDELDVAVLRDAIEGSLVPAHALDAIELSGDPKDEAWGRNTRRHFKAIERKVTLATGENVRFPKW